MAPTIPFLWRCNIPCLAVLGWLFSSPAGLAASGWIGYTELATDLPGGRHANVRTMRAMVINADGTERRTVAGELADSPDEWTQFAGWSPDGKQAILTKGWQSAENARWEEEHKTFRMDAGQWQLDACLYDPAAQKAFNPTAVERVSHCNTGLFFMPDGNRLGFTALIDGVSKPFSMDPDGRNKRDLSNAEPGFTYGFSASPDGKLISYHRDYQIFTAKADGTEQHRIETGHAFNFGPAWSPDGAWLLFVAGSHDHSHPFVVRRDGTGLRQLADRQGYQGSVQILDVPDFHEGSSDTPVWAAKENTVFYTARADDAVELFRTRLEGPPERLTFSSPGTLHYHPQPSPDGTSLAYGSLRQGVRQLFTMDLADRKETAITHLEKGRGALWPHWQPAPPVPIPAAEPVRRPWLDPGTKKPFYPLGWFEWGQPTLEQGMATLDEMAAQGSNMVLTVGGWTDLDTEAMARKNTADFLRYLDHAQHCGIKVMVQINWFGDFERKDEAVIARAKTWVEAISSHPALLGYQAYDEPESSHNGTSREETAARLAWVQAFVRMKEAIHTWDPNPDHMVQMVFNLIPHEGFSDTDWRLFLPAVDAFQTDRYGINYNFPYFASGQNAPGIWGPLRVAWQISHGVAAIAPTQHRNPAPVLQGVGLSYYEGGHFWRDPLYEETRYMAYASLTAGGWGVLHWIHNASSPQIRANVGRLYAELRLLQPALEQSWSSPPFTISQAHSGITRDWLKENPADIATTALEDAGNYYLIAADHTGLFNDVLFHLKLPAMASHTPREAQVLNEGWSRTIQFDEETAGWIIPQHTMCFGDVNVWVIPKT